MNKNSFIYRVLNSFKHLVVTTFLGLILYFFMIPINTQLPWVKPIMQVILILMFTVSIYLPFWEYGDKDNNLEIIDRVAGLAEKYGVTMTQIALAWHYAKGVAAPIVGATKQSHFDDAVKAVDLDLTDDDVRYLEEIYKPHRIVGALSE